MKSQIIKSRRPQQQLTCLLIVSCMAGCSSAASLLEQSPNDMSRYQLEQAPEYSDQQAGGDSYAAPKAKAHENPKKYLIRDADLENFSAKGLQEQLKEQIRLAQLLDSLSSALPAPIYRSSRMSASSQQQAPKVITSNSNTAPPAPLDQTQRLSADVVASKQLDGAHPARPWVRGSRSGGLIKPVLIGAIRGVVWHQEHQPSGQYPSVAQRRRASNYSNDNRYSGSQKGSHDKLPGNEEFPLQTNFMPNHDFEWKRVENSRWNNLRGMWGKRSGSSGRGPFAEILARAGGDEDGVASINSNGQQQGANANLNAQVAAVSSN